MAGVGTSIYTACTTGRETEYRKAKYVEGGKLSGNIIVGASGGTVRNSAATIGCVAVGFATGGAGALACAVIGGALGGWGVGGIGGVAGGQIGEVIYESDLS